MARTRSQPISPGGYQSLPDKPTRRRTKRGSASIDAEEEAPATKKTKTSTAKAATTKPTTSRRRTTRATSVEKKTIEKPAPITSTTTRRATRGSSVDVVIQSLETKKENKDADKPVEPITTTKTRPRTRSQPLSPNGLQMLAPKPRQRRSASVDQPESQISTAKKAPVKKSAGRKVNRISFPHLPKKK